MSEKDKTKQTANTVINVPVMEDTSSLLSSDTH